MSKAASVPRKPSNKYIRIKQTQVVAFTYLELSPNQNLLRTDGGHPGVDGGNLGVDGAKVDIVIPFHGYKDLRRGRQATNDFHSLRERAARTPKSLKNRQNCFI